MNRALTEQKRLRHGTRGPLPRYHHDAVIDCGQHGKLTVARAAEISGVPVCTILTRLSRGESGADLLSPFRERQFCRKRYTEKSASAVGKISPVVACAMEVALRFSKGALPTAQQLQSEYDMSRATAYRWLAEVKVIREKRAAARTGEVGNGGAS